MFRAAVLLGLAVLMLFPACARRHAEVSQRDMEQPPAVTSSQPAEPQAGMAGQQGQARQTNEFMGVAPKVEDIPATLTLDAKNGNVAFSHQKHAKTIDCAACHQGTPGKIPDFGKDKAHALCIGCHKEKSAGPTKCTECHKKA